MKRHWRKIREKQDMTFMNVSAAIKQGFPRHKLPNIDELMKQKKLRPSQAEDLKKLIEKYTK